MDRFKKKTELKNKETKLGLKSLILVSIGTICRTAILLKYLLNSEEMRFLFTNTPRYRYKHPEIHYKRSTEWVDLL